MKVKQQLTKVLRSALIFAMVIALCGTTLAKAYASYANIIIEHVFVDNDNTYGENESKQDSSGENDAAPAENEEGSGENDEEQNPAAGPRDALAGGIEVTIKGHGSNGACEEDYDMNFNVTAPGGGEAAIATLELDLDDVNPAQAVADTLSDQLSEQFGDDSDQKLTEEQTDTIADLIDEELEKIKAGDVDQGNVWQGAATAPNHDGLFLAPTTAPYQVALSEASKALLEDNGYGTKLLKITLAFSDNRCYVSFNNGETWTDVNEPEAGEKSFEEVNEGDGTFTYTFVHVRVASYEPEEPEEKPDPKPDPKPVPEPKPVPDPVIPVPVIPTPEDPGEEIPAPEVPLAEPEEPEEPAVEEPLEEIDEPDVPLADIPQTGDISELWYAAALLAAAGLAALLYQDRRSKKTV